jgi:hypothetical protein
VIVFIVCDRGDRYLSTGVFPGLSLLRSRIGQWRVGRSVCRLLLQGMSRSAATAFRAPW